MSGTKVDLVLENQEDVRNVQQLKERLVEVLETRRKQVRIDASAIERIDASAVQLLAAFALELRAHKRALAFAAPSQAFLRSVRGVGLAEHLGVAGAEPSEAAA